MTRCTDNTLIFSGGGRGGLRLKVYFFLSASNDLLESV